MKLYLIQPGKPIQNAFVELLNGKFRDGCLNQRWFKYLPDAQQIIEQWRGNYNNERPYSSLNCLPPSIYETQAA